MKAQLLIAAIIVSALTLSCQSLVAQSTPPVSKQEIEAEYNTAIETRAEKTMQALAMADSAKSNEVHQLLVTHYHALRARDEAIDDELNDLPKGSTEWRDQRNTMLMAMFKPFHERFIGSLTNDLTPAQIETVKDQMTYGKVQFTYNAYCVIVPGLTDDEKAKIMDLLKQAREMAMEGGSSGEKSDIFQQYKNQINSYLKTNGIDMDKATQIWTAQQKALQKPTGETNAAVVAPAS